MDEISIALIAIAMVLSAVFLPMAFFGGSTGVIYRQFSLTIVSAMVLLVMLTVRKARAKGRYHSADKRNPAAEAGPDAPDLDRLGDREPGPDEAAEFADQIAAVLDGLSVEHARVLEMRLAGDTVTQIADALALTRQSVYRMLDLLQARLRAMSEGTRP